MLFNSYAFIFLYLPVVFIGMFWLGRHSHRLSALWLGFASLTFYMVWDARFVLLLLASVTFNYGASYWIGIQAAGQKKRAIPFLAAAIAINLILLGYFKYANFVFTSTNQLFGSHIPALDVILPLGISFFTFTQIAFLVDVYRGTALEYKFSHYLLFVTYFPHLIAGPVLHHKQLMLQFANPNTYRINTENVAVGLAIFVLGLAKKGLIADSMAEYATPIFNAARDGLVLTLFDAWIGALTYTLQLYFDFSGYSDMAIGLSLMFNVRIPLNFDSPYKATNIIDFWRRWHMTLSAFLRDYIYIPLGGSRKGSLRHYVNLLSTMVLCGLWHGAGWTFIVWGGFHGIYLMINLGWRELKARLNWNDGGRFARLAAGALTFFAVVVAWVFFRADSLTSAWAILSGMAGMNGVSLPLQLEERLVPLIGKIPYLDFVVFKAFKVNGNAALVSIVSGLALVWCFPNVRQMFVTYKPAWEDIAGVKTLSPIPQGRFSRWFTWQPTPCYAWLCGLSFVLGVFSLTKVREFLYFQF